MLEICHVKRDWLPELKESYEAVGELKRCYAEKWGLAKVTVAAGAGDNAAAATGTGNVKEGDCTISLGTSGTVFISRDKFIDDAGAQLHSLLPRQRQVPPYGLHTFGGGRATAGGRACFNRTTTRANRRAAKDIWA